MAPGSSSRYHHNASGSGSHHEGGGHHHHSSAGGHRDHHHHHHPSSHHYAGSGSHAAASSSQDRLASASTALDRVMGLLDGFEDDMECPLCLEEMDISDLNFKPCPCGYQICRFCYHHIKENLNGRCPACRTPYDESTVEFKPVKPDELKRLQMAKKLRDKRKKEESAVSNRLANVRVRQKAQVHIQGMTTKIANEDTLNQLKGSDHFGKYGKVVKLFLSKRAPTPGQSTSTHPLFQPVNVYVNYRTPQEAANCISAVDGTSTPDGHRLKAVWGTTRYCPTYLKGLKCNNENCMQAHEPGEEIGEAGPASREEIYTYHAVSDNDIQRSKAVQVGATSSRKAEEAASLPSTVSWASKNALAGQPSPPVVLNPSMPPLSSAVKSTKQGSVPKPHPLPARPSARTGSAAGRPASPASKTTGTGSRDSSRPVTPAPVEVLTQSATKGPSPKPIKANGLVNGHTVGYDNSLAPLPDLDFGSGGTFSFSLDLDAKGKAKADNDRPAFDRFDSESVPSIFSTSSTAPGYIGSFDPFAEAGAGGSDSATHSAASSPPDSAARRGSRFEFARRTSQGVKTPDTSGRNALAALLGVTPSEMPFAPPGLGPNRPSSSASFSLSQASDRDSTRSGDSSGLWATTNGTPNVLSAGLPPGLVRPMASPDPSKMPSPQLSPRARAAFANGPPGLTSPAASALPPGLSVNRGPSIGAAAFPLPPPAPKSGHASQQGTTVGKDELLALIAAAQKSTTTTNATSPSAQQQEPHPFFSDPAILNARLTSQFANGLSGPPPSAAFLSLDSLPSIHGGNSGPAGAAYRGPASFSLSPFDAASTANAALPPPPGLRQPQQPQQPFLGSPSPVANGVVAGQAAQLLRPGKAL